MPQAFPHGPWRGLLAPAAEKGSLPAQLQAEHAILILLQPRKYLWSTWA